MESGQHRAGCNCGLYDSSLDQVYIGWAKEGGSQGDRWVHAVHQTGGQIVAFSGDVIPAFYTSSDGGHTENNENVWGGTPLPYLRGVCDPGDYTSANPSAVWKVSYSAGSVTNRLAGYTGNIGTVSGFTDFDRGVSGRIITVRVEGKNGSDVISGAQFRAGLGLKDDRVWVNRDKNVTGRIRATYDAASCAPGLPTSPEVDVPGGSRQLFETGAIYRNTGDVTVWLKGAVFDEYTAVGGAGGRLGLPTSKVVHGHGRHRMRGGVQPDLVRARTDLLEVGRRRQRPVGPRAGHVPRPQRRRRVAGVPDLARAGGGRRQRVGHLRARLDRVPAARRRGLHDQLTLSTRPRTSAPARCSVHSKAVMKPFAIVVA